MMRYDLIITADAQQEEANADNYYERIRAGLGEQFLQELSSCYRHIAEKPLSYSYLDTSKTLRYRKINIFPYVAIYLVSDNSIIILSVRSTHRRPFA